MAKNHYKTLGISSSATKSEIKRAYRRLAMKYHPDKNNSNHAQKLFIEINEAYAFLSKDEIEELKRPQKNYAAKTSKNFSQEELEKRMRWAKQYAQYKKIKEEKIIEINYYKIQNSSLGWITTLISRMSITLAFIIFFDFKIIPPSSFEVELVTNYIDMSSQKLALKLRDKKKNEFTFGVSFDDIKRVNIASINEYSCQKSRLFRQNTNMILKIKNQEVSIFNHYCVYKVFYFYLVILLLPLITLFSKGPNSVYILSTYVISSLSVIGMVFLLLTILI
jgi:hypothetical protein|tara:strand:+ start:5022 stop:5855 length:834 start_codon:yes stop_codon:yes gene_type:complete